MINILPFVQFLYNNPKQIPWMYQFKIRKQEDGGFRFDLGSIRLLVDDYTVKDNKHLIVNPCKAIAYFNTRDNIYGISNDQHQFETAEAFYDAISEQYTIFTNKNELSDKKVMQL